MALFKTSRIQLLSGTYIEVEVGMEEKLVSLDTSIPDEGVYLSPSDIDQLIAALQEAKKLTK